MVALGGNALTAEGQRGTYEEQRANATTMAESIAQLLDDGWRVVVVHGNGPQVGSLAIQQEEGRRRGAGAAAVQSRRHDRGTARDPDRASPCTASCGGRQPVAAMLTHVVVDLADPAFDRPTKPIGPFFSEDDARAAGRGARAGRSPRTRGAATAASSRRRSRKGFVEIDAVRCLLDAGHVVVTAGGGGIPVGRARDGVWDGVDAVIDKDYAAAELAHGSARGGARARHRRGRGACWTSASRPSGG